MSDGICSIWLFILQGSNLLALRDPAVEPNVAHGSDCQGLRGAALATRLEAVR